MPEKRKKIGIGLLGSGTVGQAVQDFVFQDSMNGADPRLEIVKIYTRRPKGKKWYGTHPSLFTTKAEEVIDHPEADIIIEALGFQEEKELLRFKDLIISALKKGKAVVTSDKAVLARHGAEIRQADLRAVPRQNRFVRGHHGLAFFERRDNEIFEAKKLLLLLESERLDNDVGLGMIDHFFRFSREQRRMSSVPFFAFRPPGINLDDLQP